LQQSPISFHLQKDRDKPRLLAGKDAGRHGVALVPSCPSAFPLVSPKVGTYIGRVVWIFDHLT
jgi:hypothetical protein